MKERKKAKKRTKGKKGEKKDRKNKGTNKRRKERERASSTPHDIVTAGKKAPQVEFLSSVLPIL